VSRQYLWCAPPLAVAVLLAAAALAHSPGDTTLGRTNPTHATPEASAAYARLLGKAPAQAVTFGDDLAVAVLPLPKGEQQVAIIGLYLKNVHRMPTPVPAGHRIDDIHLRGDMVAFRAQARDAVYDYIWDSEEPGPPFWRRTPNGKGAVTYSPNLSQSLVATFYLQDPQALQKLAAANAALKSLRLREQLYIDGAVLVLAAESATDNAVLRWLGDGWVEAGSIRGVVNHHAVADLNGDGLIEVLAGDSDAVDLCTSSWSALYTWNPAKSTMVPTPIRADSASNLSGNCAKRPPACFREESLTWDRSAHPRPVVMLRGKQDTTGCPGKDLPAGRKTYQRTYAWNPGSGAFEHLP
jgi:hypothetical protein